MYSWTHKDIYKHLDTLEQLARIETDISKKCYYLETVNSIRQILKRDEIMCNEDITQDMTSILMSISSDYYYNQRYYEIIKDFYDIVSVYNEQYNKLIKKVGTADSKIERKHYSNEETLTIARDFYRSINSEIYSYFEKMYNERYDTIKFKEEYDELERFSISGFCIFIDIIDKNYILVKDEPGIYKLKNIIHECGHGIANYIYPKASVLRKNDFLSEIPSLFFETLFLLESKSLEAPLANFTRMDYCYDSAIELSRHEKIVNAWENNMYKVNNKFYKNINKKYNLEPFEVDNSLSTSIDDDGAYIIGQFVVYKLINIYRNDKNLSLELLKKIIMSQEKDAYEVIGSIISNYDGVDTEISQILRLADECSNKILIKEY